MHKRHLRHGSKRGNVSKDSTDICGMKSKYSCRAVYRENYTKLVCYKNAMAAPKT